jgi:NADPH:quinone reductase-like Zn-dependent oxidoreductase
MRAIRLYSPGGIEDLQLEEIEEPRSRPGQVLVRVHAAAITRGELEWPSDRLPAIPSYELSGVVVEDTDDGFAAGDDVIALIPFDRDGAAAEYALLPAEALGPKPRSLSHIEAAALPMPSLTAWQALIVHGRLQLGERVGVTGAHGGVGHLAVQLARSRGAEVVAAGEPCDLLFDTGGEELAHAASRAGRVVTVVEETPRAHYFVVEPNRVQLTEVARLVDRGDLRPEIDSIFPLAEARAAFSRSAAHGKHGKVVLRVVE